MQGGLAWCNASLYVGKFFVPSINFRMLLSMPIVRGLTAAHVLCRRWIGAVSTAHMMEVNEEKLLSIRHFCMGQQGSQKQIQGWGLTSATRTKCLITLTLVLTSACVRMSCATQFVS